MEIALRASSDALAFIVELFQHLDDELTKCSQLHIPDAQCLILISDQLKIVFDDIYEVRKHVVMRDDCSKADLSATCFMATMRAHTIMGAFRSAKFRYHASISAAYIRFLAKQTGENSSAGVGTKIKTLETSLKALETSMSTAIEGVKKKADKCDSKLEDIIKKNTLKTK